MPRTFAFTSEELYDAVLDIAEKMGINSPVPEIYIDSDILPSDYFQFPEGEGGKPDNWPPTDPRRIDFMKNHPDLLFKIIGNNSKERGYYGFVFPRFLVLENNAIGNAAYFFDFTSPLEANSNRELGEIEMNNIINNTIKPIFNLTKSRFKGVGGQDRIHPAVTLDNDRWMEKMQAEIDRRS